LLLEVQADAKPAVLEFPTVDHTAANRGSVFHGRDLYFFSGLPGVVVRQKITRTDNSAIPRRGQLNSTRTLNQKSFAGRIYVAAARILRME
jgi:hypothetical protein